MITRSSAMRIAAAALAATILPSAHAVDLGDSRFALRGFGTAAATWVDSDGLEFRRTVGQNEGVGDGDVSLGVDSIVGAQFNARLSPKFDVVVQGLSRERSDGDWAVRLSQAYLRWSPDESFVLRAGRVGYDIYLLAESRQVGYSYVPVRPSPEFYGMIVDDEIDGGDVSYTHRLGRSLVRARIFGGDTGGELAFADGTHAGSDGYLYGATLDWIRGGWTARVAMVDYNYYAGDDIAPLVGGLRMTGIPSALATADDLDHDVYESVGVQLGVAYDEGPLLAQLLYGTVSSDSLAGPDFDKYYGLVGYRIQKWTPFVSFADSRDRSAVRDAGLPPLPMFAPLNGAVTTIQLATRSTAHTLSAGVRFDISGHLDVKFQVDRSHIADSALPFDRRAPGSGPTDMWVAALAMDFVF